jgi:hypothetical protein
MTIRGELRLGLLAVSLLAAPLSACESATGAEGGGGDGDGDADGDTDSDTTTCSDGETECQAGDFYECEDSAWVMADDCSGDAPSCDDVLGCVACTPGEEYCVGDDVWVCADDGGPGTYSLTCPAGDTCTNGICSSACEAAAGGKSYMGCEFLAVSTTNNLLSTAFDSDFAVIIGNPGTSPATVTVSRAGSTLATDTVEPASSKAIQLPFVTELKNAAQTVLVTDGAYEIKSDVPVVAYQYNPLHFSTGDTDGYSYTNDASLLLPIHTLTGNYMASTWPTWGHGTWTKILGAVSGSWSGWSPGFVAIAGTEDGTQVTITSATYIQGGAITALGPGESATATLNRADVLQVLSQVPEESNDLNYCASMGWQSDTDGACPPTLMTECEAYCWASDGDITGTTVNATKPVAVFAGHNCTFMPFNSWACDHLEEMMFPLETWGNDFIMTAPEHPQGTGVVQTMYRVLAQEDGTAVTFEPEVYGNSNLARGEFLEFQTDQDFRVSSGDKQIYVTQALMGQDFFENSDSGDPAMGSGIPVFQSRSVYTFLTPDTYTYNFVNIIAPEGEDILLDGTAVTAWNTIGATGYRVARVPLSPGSHLAEGDGAVGFGITSYGYAPYTSYLFPGGMNIEEFVVE